MWVNLWCDTRCVHMMASTKARQYVSENYIISFIRYSAAINHKDSVNSIYNIICSTTVVCIELIDKLIKLIFTNRVLCCMYCVPPTRIYDLTSFYIQQITCCIIYNRQKAQKTTNIDHRVSCIGSFS